jgi:cell wall-associated NlpC family hydrolase
MAKNQNNANRDSSSIPLTPPGWVQRYIGIPFKDLGYDFNGCNCWGLVHLVLKERAGIEVNPYSDVSARERDLAAYCFGVESVDWFEVKQPKVYDVVLIRGEPLHTGIVVAPGWLLHVWRAPASIAMTFDNPRIRARISAFYRNKLLDERDSSP